MKANEGWRGMVGQHGGVGLGRRKCFFRQTMGGDGSLKSTLGNDVSKQRKMLRDIGGIELKGQKIKFER